MPRLIALTGGIACGKSTVEHLLEELGAVVIDADKLAREVTAPGTDGLAEIVREFGAECLQPDGTLDRESLGRRVFGDDEARRRLNRIVHPRIAVASATRIAEAMSTSVPLVVYSAALLVESSTHAQFPALLVVTCSPQTQLRRLMQRDGLTADLALERIRAQLPLADKEAVATWVLHNDDSVDSLRQQTARLFEAITSTP
jgi:dephospho-CoA kinase